MSEPTIPLICKIFDAKGEILSEITLAEPFSTIKLPDNGADKINIEGTAEIYEIIPNR